MSLQHILMACLFSVGMGGGQLLLKFAAQRQSPIANQVLTVRLLSLLTDWAFLCGVVVYGLLLVYWVWLLTFLPLSKVYPFTLVSLIVATIGGYLLFHEALTPRFVLGLAVIGFGLVILGTE